jgi:hypothetical protein
MKYLFSQITKLNLLFLIGILVVLTGCTPQNHEGFAIYLTQDNISWDKMPALNQIKIANTPLIATSDIVSYTSSKHQLTITDDASSRISNLVVPMDGTSFVVCVNRKPIYWGVFWSLYSSAFTPTSCVIVSYPLSNKAQLNPSEIGQIDPHILELDYSGNNDPRNNAEILKSLEQTGKLITSTTTSITSTTATTSTNSNSASSNSISGLSLSLSLDGTIYQPGQQVSITVDEANTLSEINNVPVSNNRPYSSLQAAPCDYISPYGIAVFQGNYTASTFSAGTPLTLYDPHVARLCPTIYGITSYSFEPSSDMAAVIEGSNPSPTNSSQQMKYELTINGYWSDDNFSSNSQLTDFAPGVHTVVAGDEWGALVIVHFTVTS